MEREGWRNGEREGEMEMANPKIESIREWFNQQQLYNHLHLLPVLSEIFPFQWEDNETTSAFSASEKYETLKILVALIVSKWGEGKFTFFDLFSYLENY